MMDLYAQAALMLDSGRFNLQKKYRQDSTFALEDSFVMGFIAASMEKMIVESSSGKSRLLLTIIMRSMKVYLNLPEFSLHFG